MLSVLCNLCPLCQLNCLLRLREEGSSDGEQERGGPRGCKMDNLHGSQQKSGALHWCRKELCRQRVLEWHFAGPGRAAELQGIFTRRFSAPSGEAKLELSRNYSLPGPT